MAFSRHKMAKRYVATLQRRQSHLEEVMQQSDRTDLSYLRAEHGALTWALPWLEDAVEEERIKEAVEAERLSNERPLERRA